MRLHQAIINETPEVFGQPKHSTQLVDLTLREIIDAGKVTNPYQLFVMGRLACFFKTGLKSVDLDMENPVNYGAGETTTEVKEAMAKLDAKDQVQLAQYLLDCIQAGECALHDKDSNTADWIHFVLGKQR